VLTGSERRILDAIDADETAALVTRLVRARSENPPGGEEEVAQELAAACRERGIDARLDEVAPGRPNVHARIGDGGGLLLLGHTDTVPAGDGWTADPFAGAHQDGRIVGRGAADMKAGIAAAVIAMAALKHTGLAVELAAVVDEEESGLGVQAMLARTTVDARAAIVPEPTELQTIVACRGNCYVDVEVQGRSAHAGSPEQGHNAIYDAARIVDAVRGLHAQAAEHTHPLLGQAGWSVGVIRGGTGTAMVPDRCRISIDRRLLPGQRGEDAREEIAALVEELGVTATAELLMEIPSFEIPPSHPLATAARAATVDAGGPDREAAGWTAACDGGYLMRDTGIPTVVLGPGSVVGQAHRPDESVAVDEVVAAARAYALIALRHLTP
jgi:acetylornithine deacetylase/succinyl-diaminopimelate desuccinylase family protein